MAMNMNAMLKIRADVDGQNKIVALNRGLQGLGTTAAGVTGAMRGLTGASAGLSGALGTLAPLLSVAGLAGMVKGTLDAADNMNDLAQATGVSVEALSRFNKAAAVSGTNLEGVSKGLVKLNKAMVDAATGGKESAATFAALGVNVKGADGQLKSADRVMLEVANRFKAMPDGAVKTALALRLFGKSGAELVPLLNMGGDAIDKLSTKMTTAFAQKADEYTDKLAVLGGKVRALGMDLTIALLPALETITDALTVAVSAFSQLPAPLQNAAIGAATLALAWGPLTSVLKGGLGLVASVANGMEILRYQTALAGGVMPMLIGHIRGLSAAILAIPGWGWVLAGVTALGLLGKALYDNNEGFRNWVNNVGKIISNDFGNAMKTMAGLAKGAWDYISRGWQWLTGVASSAATAIGNAFAGPFGFIRNAAQQAFGGVAQAIARMWNSLPEPIRKALGQAGKMAVQAIGSSPVGYLASVGIRAAQMGGPTGGGVSPKGDFLGGGGSSFSPNMSAIGGGAGGGASSGADKAKQIRENITASAAALQQSKAELAILRELDPVKKIQLEYAERRRVVEAAAAQDLGKALSVEEQANIQRRRAVDLQKLQVEETNALKEKYKELGDAAYDAALKQQMWGTAAQNANTAMVGFRDGISSYLESIGTLGEGISSLTQNSIKGLEDAIVSLTTTGTFNFRQMALSIVEEATRMVTRLLIIAPILQGIQSLLTGIGGGIGAGFPSGAGLLSKGKLFPGGVFANGGIVDSPTLFKFANGGAGNLGLMGEAGPEAIMPLRRGPDGKLGVAGGGGGTNITVNVDAKGTSVQGDPGRGDQLARVVAQAVQAELIKQKRPGGLMAA
jgi:lambda family phage tail tape measure protein